MQKYLDNQWETEDVKEAVTALRKLALEDQEESVEGFVAIPGEVSSYLTYLPCSSGPKLKVSIVL